MFISRAEYNDLIDRIDDLESRNMQWRDKAARLERQLKEKDREKDWKEEEARLQGRIDRVAQVFSVGDQITYAGGRVQIRKMPKVGHITIRNSLLHPAPVVCVYWDKAGDLKEAHISLEEMEALAEATLAKQDRERQILEAAEKVGQ